MYLHCAHCLSKGRPDRVAVRLTKEGLEIMCEACGLRIAMVTPEWLKDKLAHPPGCACCKPGELPS